MKTQFKNTFNILTLIFHFGMFSQISEEEIYSEGADLMCECFGDVVQVSEVASPTQYCLKQINFAFERNMSEVIKVDSPEAYREEQRRISFRILEESVVSCSSIYESSLIVREQGLDLVSDKVERTDDKVNWPDSVLRQSAYHSLRLKKYDEALFLINLALEKNKAARSYLSQSMIYEALGDYDLSLKSLALGLDILKVDPFFSIQKGIVRHKAVKERELLKD